MPHAAEASVESKQWFCMIPLWSDFQVRFSVWHVLQISVGNAEAKMKPANVTKSFATPCFWDLSIRLPSERIPQHSTKKLISQASSWDTSLPKSPVWLSKGRVDVLWSSIFSKSNSLFALVSHRDLLALWAFYNIIQFSSWSLANQIAAFFKLNWIIL